MILSRSGLELNEIWRHQADLVEADERLRRLARVASADHGDAQAQHRYDAGLARSGSHEQKAERIGPAMRAYETAKESVDNARNRLEREGNWPHLRAERERAKEAHKQRRNDVREQARRLGSPAGSFLRPKEEPHFRHMERMAALHNVRGQSSKGSNTKVHFFDNDRDRDEFHAAVEHHYGNKYKVESLSREKHGTFSTGAMAKREEPHRVVIRDHTHSSSFENWHKGDS